MCQSMYCTTLAHCIVLIIAYYAVGFKAAGAIFDQAAAPLFAIKRDFRGVFISRILLQNAWSVAKRFATETAYHIL